MIEVPEVSEYCGFRTTFLGRGGVWSCFESETGPVAGAIRFVRAYETRPALGAR